MAGGLSAHSIASLVIFGLALAFGVALFLVPQPQAPSPEGQLPRFDAQGHRGARGLAPANTLPAFRAALATGVTTLEMDLRLSADGVLMVHHDARLDPRRTRGPDDAWIEPPGPRLSALTAAEIARYDIGRARPGGEVARRFPDQRPADGARVPRLSEALALGERLSGGRVRYSLETKLRPDAPGGTPDPAAFAKAVLGAARVAGVTARTTVQSFDWRTLREVRARDPVPAIAFLTAERSRFDTVERGEAGTSPWTAGYDVDAYNASLPAAIHAAAAAFAGAEPDAPPPPVERVIWAPNYRDLRPPQLDEAHRRGLHVVVWTVNDPGDMASLIDLGVDGIVTDYPERLRRVMREKDMELPAAYPAAAE